MKGGQPLICEVFGPGADTPKVSRIADRHNGKTVGASARRGDRHRLLADHLAVAEPAVDHHGSTAVGDDFGMAIGQNLTRPHPVDIFVDPHDAVRIVAGQIGFDQMGSDDLGFLAA